MFLLFNYDCGSSVVVFASRLHLYITEHSYMTVDKEWRIYLFVPSKPRGVSSTGLVHWIVSLPVLASITILPKISINSTDSLVVYIWIVYTWNVIIFIGYEMLEATSKQKTTLYDIVFLHFVLWQCDVV